MRWLLAAATLAVAATLALPMLVVLAVAHQQTGPTVPATGTYGGIPPRLLDLYQQATATYCPGMPWQVLAAIGKVESDHARTGGATLQLDGTTEPPIIGPPLDGTGGLRHIADTNNGRLDGDPVYDRAVGPMQFLPETWQQIGFDANNDGTANPHSIYDAIPTAAVYLCQAGADHPDRLRQAIWTYNNSTAYVDQVLAIARSYEHTTITAPGDVADLGRAVLNNPRIHIYTAGRDDIRHGRIDPRVLALLQTASQHWTLSISSLKTGHSRCVGGHDHPGCRVSHHWHGRAVDIHRVNSQPVDASNRHARQLADWLHKLDGNLRPGEVGTPWADLATLPGYFTDPAHQHHIHIGYR